MTPPSPISISQDSISDLPVVPPHSAESLRAQLRNRILRPSQPQNSFSHAGLRRSGRLGWRCVRRGLDSSGCCGGRCRGRRIRHSLRCGGLGRRGGWLGPLRRSFAGARQRFRVRRSRVVWWFRYFFPARAVARTRAFGSSAFSVRMISSSEASIFFRRSAAVWPRCGFMRMSNGPSPFVEKPREGLSSCMEETPRSARIMSTPGTSSSPQDFWQASKIGAANGYNTSTKTQITQPLFRSRQLNLDPHPNRSGVRREKFFRVRRGRDHRTQACSRLRCHRVWARGLPEFPRP